MVERTLFDRAYALRKQGSNAHRAESLAQLANEFPQSTSAAVEAAFDSAGALIDAACQWAEESADRTTTGPARLRFRCRTAAPVFQKASTATPKRGACTSQSSRGPQFPLGLKGRRSQAQGEAMLAGGSARNPGNEFAQLVQGLKGRGRDRFRFIAPSPLQGDIVYRIMPPRVPSADVGLHPGLDSIVPSGLPRRTSA